MRSLSREVLPARIGKYEWQIQALIWILLFFLSLWFYKERICWRDASWCAINILSERNFFENEFRYYSLLSQWLPVMLTRLSSDLSLILMAYSVCPLLSMCLLSILSIRTGKSLMYGWIILAAYLWWISTSFFYVVSMPIGFALCVCMLSFLQRFDSDNNRRAFVLGSVAIALILPFTHVMVVLCALLLLAFAFIQRKQIPWYFWLLSLILFCITFLAFKELLPSAVQDERKMLLWNENLSQFNLAKSNFVFFLKFKAAQPAFLGSVILVLFVLLRNKEGRSLLLLLSASVFCLAVFAIYHMKRKDSEYPETYLMTLSFLWMTAFFHSLYRHKNGLFIRALVLFVFMLSFIQIQRASQFHHQRLEYLNHLNHNPAIPVNQMKLSIHPSQLSYANLRSEQWALPFESLLLSRLENSHRTIFIKRYHQSALDSTNFFASPVKVFYQDSILKAPYFSMPRQSYLAYP